ncbi:DNA modification methylase [Actinomadura sp.]|uniref:DNA modification methylase n=1 Tax=Actinomadura sp. TaxID=1989 RepID=UPI0037CC52C4
MKIELRATEKVRPYERNPRLNDAAVAAVARSLQEFGFRQPIVVDAEGVIIVGHTRWKAAQQLGLKKVPVHVADLDETKARAYRIADNQTATIAEWDMDLLPGELRDLEGAGFDLSVLGWGQEDLDAMLAEVGGGGGAGEDADDVPEPPKVALTRPGDLWVLGGEGGHRLLCGDSTKPGDVDRLLNGERAALCATDPPYLVDYTGERPDDSGKDWSDTYREVEITDAESFFTGVFTNVLRVLAPHAAIYCWHAHKRQRLIAEVWERLGILDHQQIVWVKPTPVFGRVFWHFRHEPCMMGWRQGSMPEHDSDHEFSSVWEVDWEGKSRIVGNEHPTQKPVEIFARPMRKHTRPGDLCYEPFSGSGSQLIAAESLGRRCCAMELEPVFVDVAVRRWEKYTGKTARRYGPDGVELSGMAAAPTDEEERDGAEGTTENTPAQAAGVGEG